VALLIIFYIFSVVFVQVLNNAEGLSEGLYQSNTCFSDEIKHVVVWRIVLVFFDDIIIYTVDVTIIIYI